MKKKATNKKKTIIAAAVIAVQFALIILLGFIISQRIEEKNRQDILDKYKTQIETCEKQADSRDFIGTDVKFIEDKNGHATGVIVYFVYTLNNRIGNTGTIYGKNGPIGGGWSFGERKDPIHSICFSSEK